MEKAWIAMKKKLIGYFKSNNTELWRWGDFHRDIMAHIPLGWHPLLKKIFNREAKGWGNLHTPNVAKCDRIESEDYSTSHRANLRHIFDFGGSSWWIIDGGVN